ncbi:uncharacterized protein ARMOST_17514 [Armillaria ostoyae]|uniref:Uncharacterized protein n=1 Tax=Armillaria ostoyae TaxID=47428 RepID=A0A284RZ64_ARMOS|nr:uncharacterized protein ARMOST_17514 [Armillaria ostoyae]
MSVDNGRTWRMVQTDDQNRPKAMVFTIQGIITRKALPPVNAIPLDSDVFLQQHVQLMRLCCLAFNLKETSDTILEAQLTSERQFAEDIIQKWTPDSTDDFIGTNLSHHYLKNRRAYPQEEAACETVVDTKEILADATCSREI